MVEGTDPVATLPAPVGKLTYNEWHAAIMGIATAILPTLTLILSYRLYHGEDRIAGLVFASGALTYAGAFIALATIARFLDGVPVLRESWYFLFTYISVLLVGTRVGITVV